MLIFLIENRPLSRGLTGSLQSAQILRPEALKHRWLYCLDVFERGGVLCHCVCAWTWKVLLE